MTGMVLHGLPRLLKGPHGYRRAGEPQSTVRWVPADPHDQTDWDQATSWMRARQTMR